DAIFQRYSQASTIAQFVEFMVFIVRQVSAMPAEFTRVVAAAVSSFCQEIQ
ncbi:unnamed protein product, partial [Amoebophrya sp. A120]